MGQSTSAELQSPTSPHGTQSPTSPSFSSIFTSELDFLHEQIRRHSLTLRQLTDLGYEDYQAKVSELNDLSSKFVDCNGKQLVFELKDAAGSKSPEIFWKARVRVSCCKIDPETKAVEKRRELNLKQFLQVYNTMTQMASTLCLQDPSLPPVEKEEWRKWDTSLGEEAAASVQEGTPRKKPMFSMSSSILMDLPLSPEGKSGEEECCICMERKPEITLPCCHSYCLACISQWNVNSKTCPNCRQRIENTDESWVLEDKPDSMDVQMEIEKSLFGLTK